MGKGLDPVPHSTPGLWIRVGNPPISNLPLPAPCRRVYSPFCLFCPVVPGLASRGWPILVLFRAVLIAWSPPRYALAALACPGRSHLSDSQRAATRPKYTWAALTVHCPATAQSRLSAQPSSHNPPAARTHVQPWLCGSETLRQWPPRRFPSSTKPSLGPWDPPSTPSQPRKGPGLGPINHHVQSPCPPT